MSKTNVWVKFSTKIDQTDVFWKLYKLGIFQVKKGQNII